MQKDGLYQGVDLKEVQWRHMKTITSVRPKHVLGCSRVVYSGYYYVNK